MVEKTTARARSVGIIDQIMVPMMSSVRNLEAGGKNYSQLISQLGFLPRLISDARKLSSRAFDEQWIVSSL
jgi:hypothetical protein